MKRTIRRSFWVAFLGTVLAVSMASSAWAAPLAPARDRSDNGIFFEYDAETHQMPKAGSARTFTPNDRVDFLVSIALAPEGSEAPLTSVLSLRLLKRKDERAVRYRGTITVRVRDLVTDDIVTEVAVPVDVILRPQPGKRRASLSAPLDLPSGEYEARAVYRAAS